MTTSHDGFIRLYGPDLKLLRKQKAPGGERPFFARFSPDGTRIAVGYDDTTRVDVLAADDLRLLYQADTETVGERRSWQRSPGRQTAGSSTPAGSYDDGSGRSLIRRWADGGRGGFTEFAVGTNTIMDLKPLRDGGLAVGAADPLVAVLDANGRAVWQRAGEIADFRGQRGQWSFGISADGRGDPLRLRAVGEAAGRVLFPRPEARPRCAGRSVAAGGGDGNVRLRRHRLGQRREAES